MGNKPSGEDGPVPRKNPRKSVYKNAKGYKWLQSLNAEEGFSEADAKRIFQEYDINGDGVLDSKEAKMFFKHYLKAKKIKLKSKDKETKLANLFKLFDHKGVGSVTWEDLCTPALPGMLRQTSQEAKNKSSTSTDTKQNSPQKSSEVLRLKEASDLGSVFETYRAMSDEDEDEQCLAGPALEAFLGDLGGNDEMTFLCLLVMYKLGASTVGEITREEFMKFGSQYRCKNFVDIKSCKRNWQTEIQNKQVYKKFYTWCFTFYLEDPHHKQINPEDAQEVWSTMLSNSVHNWGLHSQWQDFMQGKINESKTNVSINKDLWIMLYELSCDLRDDLSNLDDVDEGFFPPLIDNFFDFLDPDGEN